MTDEEAAVKVQAGLRAMCARKYVDVIRTYEKTMKMMAEEEEKKEEERRKERGERRGASSSSLRSRRRRRLLLRPRRRSSIRFFHLFYIYVRRV